MRTPRILPSALVSVLVPLIAATLGASVAGCKGDTVVKPDPKTQADLDQCNKDKQSLTDYKKQLEQANADLQNKAGSGSNEIIVAFDGNILTVRPPRAGEPAHPIDDKATTAASTAFVNLVQRSRGAIQKCYEQALKKRTDLQAKTISLSVSATFSSSGAFQNASFAPQIDSAFDSCMQNIAQKWTMPTNSPAMTFKAPVSLTPT